MILPNKIYILPWINNNLEQKLFTFRKINEHDSFPDFSAICKISENSYVLTGGLPNSLSTG